MSHRQDKRKHADGSAGEKSAAAAAPSVAQLSAQLAAASVAAETGTAASSEPVTLTSWSTNGGGGNGTHEDRGTTASAGTSEEQQQEPEQEATLQEKDEMLGILKQPSIAQMILSSRAKATPPAAAAAPARAAVPGAHKFWDTQPVPKLSAPAPDAEGVGPLDPATDVSAVRADPYPLPSGFTWSTVDVQDAAQLREMYELLSENYVEDDDNMFRFNYTPEFLLWALTPPGYFPDWLVGVRTGTGATGRLVACITGIPVEMRVSGRTVKMCEINFLCNHKKLRAKRLAPVLIKEVTRRVNLTGIWQAAYTAGVVLPKPVTSCR